MRCRWPTNALPRVNTAPPRTADCMPQAKDARGPAAARHLRLSLPQTLHGARATLTPACDPPARAHARPSATTPRARARAFRRGARCAACAGGCTGSTSARTALYLRGGPGASGA